MPLRGEVGKHRPRARLALVLLYAVLTLGAITTLYPFATMISIGFKSTTDQNTPEIIPSFLSHFSAQKPDGSQEPSTLLGKYLDDKYAGDAKLVEFFRQQSLSGAGDPALYENFLLSLPNDHFQAGFRAGASQVTSRLNKRYQDFLKAKYSTIDALNDKYSEQNTAFQSVAPPVELLETKNWKPTKDAKYDDFQEFKTSLPAEFRIPILKLRLFQNFVASKFRNQLKDAPTSIVGAATSFEAVSMPSSGDLLKEFEDTKLPEALKARSNEELWDAAGGVGAIPVRQYDEGTLQTHESSIRNEFLGRNYAYVVDYVALNGRILWNTLIFAGLAILTQLTINPLAAYALSRYPIKSTGRILIFLLATMSFPAEVSMIPGFLLIKQLGLLNSFAALVLPSAASGYMIFLLKGFFDSLPKELFEAGTIDGAKETKLLTKIALPLARPVMGYLALLAYMGAYGAFLYAFLVAQDRKIWTVMVWIYQLQGIAPRCVMMAALSLACLPTILVFLFAQKVIMRGVIIPGER